nr:hypothetical protein [Tanacetum cinerariifolium]
MLITIPTPPPSPLTSYLSPLPQIPSPPLPTSPTNTGAPSGYMAAMIWLRAESPSTFHPVPLPLPPPVVLLWTPPLLPIPLSTSSPPLLLPSTECRADVSEVTLPPRKRLCIAIGLRFEIRRDADREIVYGITNVWEDPNEIAEEIPATNVEELSQRVIDFVTTVKQDTYEIYRRLDDAYDDRLLMSDQLNLLCRYRCSHARTARLIESEARASREAWTEIEDLRAVDHKQQIQLAEVLTLVRILQTQMVALQSQQRPARDPAHPDKMAPTRRTTRTSPVMTITTTPIINAQLEALIDHGIADAVAVRDADKSQNGDDSRNSRTGSRRT